MWRWLEENFRQHYSLAIVAIAGAIVVSSASSYVLSTQTAKEALEARLRSSSIRLELEEAQARLQRSIENVHQASAGASDLINTTSTVQAKFARTTAGTEAKILELTSRVAELDRRLADFEAMIGKDDRVKVLMTTTAMAQEIAERKKFQDSFTETLKGFKNEMDSTIEPVRSKLDALQIWLIATLIAVVISLCGVVWFLVRRLATLYPLVNAIDPAERERGA